MSLGILGLLTTTVLTSQAPDLQWFRDLERLPVEQRGKAILAKGLPEVLDWTVRHLGEVPDEVQHDLMQAAERGGRKEAETIMLAMEEVPITHWRVLAYLLLQRIGEPALVPIRDHFKRLAPKSKYVALRAASSISYDGG